MREDLVDIDLCCCGHWSESHGWVRDYKATTEPWFTSYCMECDCHQQNYTEIHHA